MTSGIDNGLAVMREMMPDLFTDADTPTGAASERFAGGLGEQSLESVFGRLWVRPGLDRRSRSLVTVGILIARRADSELEVHFPIALRNGLTREELEEVVYHSAGYAGFPAAAAAQRIGSQVLDDREAAVDPQAELDRPGEK